MSSILDQLLSHLPSGTSLQLETNADTALSLPKQQVTFVRPPLTTPNDIDIKDFQPPFAIISAPGAVGKSTLAHFIAAEKNCHLWDLSKLKLGTNTFRGTLANSFEITKLPDLINDIKKGQVLFVFDAFDEAEIVSGWQRIEEFLVELLSFVKEAPNICLVLLARSETSTYMSLFLEELAEKNGLEKMHVTFSIEYFVESQARQFIEQYLQYSFGKSAYGQHYSSYKEAIDTVFSLFYDAVRTNGQDGNPWNTRNVRSFLGYAPVLQTIAQYFAQFDNFIHIKNDFADSQMFEDGVELICTLMEKLLIREQSKVIERLRQTDAREALGWDQWDQLYTPNEQLQRIFLRSQRRKTTDISLAQVEVPTWLIEEYTRAIDTFIEQHPFLIEGKFTGPAFQDYTFARLLSEEYLYDDVKSVWHQVTSDNSTYVASPLFSHLYWKLNNGGAYGDLVGFLYESASSQQNFESQSRLIIVPREDNGQDRVHTLKIIYSQDENVLLNETTLDFEIIIDEDHALTFPRQLTHAFVEVDGAVVLGKSNIEFEISDVEIKCKSITIRSNTIVIRNYQNDEGVLMTSDVYHQIPALVNVDCNNNRMVTISWPDGKQHPWADYYKEHQPEIASDTDKVLFGLRRLLSFFRKDKKNYLARHRDLIEQVAIGSNTLRQNLRDYLLEKGILQNAEYRRNLLYKLDIDKLKEFGINWYDLVGKERLNKDMEQFIEEFIKNWH